MSIEPMVDFYRDTEVGHRLQSIGREEGREAVLLALLQSRFGDCSPVREVARRLADGDDQAAAVAAIMRSPDLLSLVSAQASSAP
ncbi:MAG TPA: hypothetical protein VLL08_04345 [Kineosporiaceae bacterium]|nr:hypothetical protein [Kineosporiaceae bacterium]